MRDGGKSVALKRQLLHFNGGLFEKAEALPVTEAQLELLIEAGKADWRHVEPAIFGTLLERALNPRDRHKLGAHYPPREYVERLVLPTIIAPLTAAWETFKAMAMTHLERGQTEAARKLLKGFHHQLCTTMRGATIDDGRFATKSDGGLRVMAGTSVGQATAVQDSSDG